MWLSVEARRPTSSCAVVRTWNVWLPELNWWAADAMSERGLVMPWASQMLSVRATRKATPSARNSRCCSSAISWSRTNIGRPTRTTSGGAAWDDCMRMARYIVRSPVVWLGRMSRPSPVERACWISGRDLWFSTMDKSASRTALSASTVPSAATSVTRAEARSPRSRAVSCKEEEVGCEEDEWNSGWKPYSTSLVFASSASPNCVRYRCSRDWTVITPAISSPQATAASVPNATFHRIDHVIPTRRSL